MKYLQTDKWVGSEYGVDTLGEGVIYVLGDRVERLETSSYSSDQCVAKDLPGVYFWNFLISLGYKQLTSN